MAVNLFVHVLSVKKARACSHNGNVIFDLEGCWVVSERKPVTALLPSLLFSVCTWRCAFTSVIDMMNKAEYYSTAMHLEHNCTWPSLPAMEVLEISTGCVNMFSSCRIVDDQPHCAQRSSLLLQDAFAGECCNKLCMCTYMANFC